MRGAVISAALLGAVGLALTMCACENKPTVTEPRPDDIVLQVGPVRLSDGDLHRFVAWAKRLDPALSPAQIRRVTVTDYYIPYFVARGLAGTENVARAKAAAEAFHGELVAAGGGFEAFRLIAEKRGAKLDDNTEYLRPFNTLSLSMSVAAFETPLGGYSDVIASTVGFSVLGVVDEKFDGILRRRLLMASFPYDTSPSFGALVKKASVEMVKERAFVHPRYRGDFESVFRNRSEDWPPPN